MQDWRMKIANDPNGPPIWFWLIAIGITILVVALTYS